MTEPNKQPTHTLHHPTHWTSELRRTDIKWSYTSRSCDEKEQPWDDC